MTDYFEVAKTITRNHVRKIMQSPEQDLESRANPEAPDCANCGHSAHASECEYEPGDRWVTGNQTGEPTVLMAMPPCGCRNYAPVGIEDVLDTEGQL